MLVRVRKADPSHKFKYKRSAHEVHSGTYLEPDQSTRSGFSQIAEPQIVVTLPSLRHPRQNDELQVRCFSLGNIRSDLLRR